MKNTLLSLLLFPALALAETRTVTKDKDTQNLTDSFHVPSGVTINTTGTGAIEATAVKPGSPLAGMLGDNISQLWDPVVGEALVKVSDGNLQFTDQLNEVTFAAAGAQYFRQGLFGHIINFGGNFSTSGSSNLVLTTIGPTNVTFPTSGTLATLSELAGFAADPQDQPTFNAAEWSQGLFGYAVTFGRNFSITGSGAVTLAVTGATNLILPPSGTLATTAYVAGEIDSLHDAVADEINNAKTNVWQLWDPANDWYAVEVSDSEFTFSHIEAFNFLGNTASAFRLGLFGRAVSFGGNFSTTGSSPVTLTITGATNLTLPTNGTLATTSYVMGEIEGLHDVVNDQINEAKATVTQLWDDTDDYAAITVNDQEVVFASGLSSFIFNGSTASAFRLGLFGKAVSFGGHFSTIGSGTVVLTITGATNLTLPPSGTLATVAQLNAAVGQLLPSSGGVLDGDFNLTPGSTLQWDGTDFIAGDGGIYLHGIGLCTTWGDQIIEPGGAIHLFDAIYYGAQPIISGFGTILERSANQTIGSIDLSSADGNFISLAGNGAVASLGNVTAGASFTIRVGGNATFQNGALHLPGGQDIYAVAGDILTFRSLGAGEWVLTEIFRNAVATSVSRTPATALVLADGVTVNVTQINIPRGRWEYWGWVTTEYSGAGIYGSSSAITTSSATIPSDGTAFSSPYRLPAGDDSTETQPILPRVVNLSTETPYFLVTQKGFSDGSAVAWGQIFIKPVP